MSKTIAPKTAAAASQGSPFPTTASINAQAKKNAAKPAPKPAAKPAVKVTPKTTPKTAATKPAAKAAPAAGKPKAAPKAAAAKTEVKTAAKAALKAKPAAAKAKAPLAKPAAKRGARPAAKALVKAEAVEAVKEKERKPKLVRDSFTMPEAEYEVLGQVKKACLKAGFEIRKSELLRIGVALISQIDLATLQSVLTALPQLKTGRPKKN